MGSSKLKKIIAALGAALLLLYVGYQVFRSNHEEVRTETAIYGTVWDSVDVSAKVFRKEYVLNQEIHGVMDYAVEDGTHVSKNGLVAKIYSSEKDIDNKHKREALIAEIQRLKKLEMPGETYALSPGLLDENIGEQLIDLLISLNLQNRVLFTEEKENLLYLLNQKQIITGKANGFSDRIAKLEQELESIGTENSEIGQLNSPTAGYFIHTVDGYESVYDYENVLSLRAQDLESEIMPSTVPENSVGKICEDYVWYIAFSVDADTALRFKTAENDTGRVYMTIPSVSEEKVPAEIVALNQESFEEDAAVILKCTYMNESLATLRNVSMQIELGSYSGVMVSQNAIHYETITETVEAEDETENTVLHENVKGVFVERGGKLSFVQIFSDITVNGYVICREPNEGEMLYTDDTVNLYDEVVVEGTDLYDGKLLI